MSYKNVEKLVKDFTVIDFETTGFNEKMDKIIQIGAVKYQNQKQEDELDILINPGVVIPDKITEITGITNEDVKKGESIEKSLVELVEFIGNDIIVAHNAPFDMRFLLQGLENGNICHGTFKVADTLELSRKYIEGTKNHKLPTLKKYLGYGHLESHDALDDCIVAGELYNHCYRKSVEMGDTKEELELEI